MKKMFCLLVMTLKNRKKLNFFFLLFFSITFLLFLFFLNFWTQLNKDTDGDFESTFVDEINPTVVELVTIK